MKRSIIVAISIFCIATAAGLSWAFWPRAVHAPEQSVTTESSLHDDVNAASEEAESAADTSLAMLAQHSAPGNVLQAPLIAEESLSFATTLAKSGEASLIGKALGDGLFLYLNKVNSQYGGLGGQFRLRLDQRDDGGQLLTAAHHINDLLSKTPLFFSPMGDVAFEKAYLPLLRAGKAALFFPAVGMRPQLDAPAPLVFFRPSYVQEVAALVHYAISILKKNKIAVFYEESAWGKSGYHAVEKLLAEQGVSLAGAAAYQPGTVNISAALNEMRNVEPHVVICVASGRPAYNFIREAVNQQLHYMSFLGISRLDGIAQHLQDSRGITLVTTSVVPNPHNSQLPIVQEYRADMQQYLPNKGLATHSLEGYINSMLLVYYLQQLSSGALVQDVWQAMLQTQNVWFKGLALHCVDNTLSQTIWINEGADREWHEYTVRI